jgi:hypothetical protein
VITPNDIVIQALELANAGIIPVGSGAFGRCQDMLFHLIEQWHNEGIIPDLAPVPFLWDKPLYLRPGWFEALSYNLALELESFFGCSARGLTHTIAHRLKSDLTPRVQVSLPIFNPNPATKSQFLRPNDTPVFQFSTEQGPASWDVAGGSGWTTVQINPEYYLPTLAEEAMIRLLLEAKAEYHDRLLALRA